MGGIVKVVKGGRFLGWYIRYKDADGRRKQRASHQPTREAARRYLLEVEARIARGMIGIPEPEPPAPPFREVAERFLTEYVPNRCKRLDRYRHDARSTFRRVDSVLGDRPVDVITAEDIVALRHGLLAGYKPRTVRVTMGSLSVLFNWAVRRGLSRANPCKGVARPQVEQTIEYLSHAEVARLLAEARCQAERGDLTDRLLSVCVHFALHTGLRKGELLGLRWTDLDLDSRRLTVARSFDLLPKSGKPRHLRLPAACVPILSTWLPDCPRTAERLVFPKRRLDGTWAMAVDSNEMLGLSQLLDAAGCRPLARPWHALRHTFASHYVMAGGNILALQKILGHQDIAHTLIYAHLAPDYLGDEMDRIKFQ